MVYNRQLSTRTARQHPLRRRTRSTEKILQQVIETLQEHQNHQTQVIFLVLLPSYSHQTFVLDRMRHSFDLVIDLPSITRLSRINKNKIKSLYSDIQQSSKTKMIGLKSQKAA